MKILIVEDNPATARLVRESLVDSSLGPESIDMAGTLLAASELGPTRYDVVLLDLGLPDAQGIATVRAARAWGAGIPLVVLTGHDDPDTAILALREGADDYLVKNSVDPTSLARVVRYAVERRSHLARETHLLGLLHSIAETVTGQVDVDAAAHAIAGELIDHTHAELALMVYACNNELGHPVERVVARTSTDFDFGVPDSWSLEDIAPISALVHKDEPRPVNDKPLSLGPLMLPSSLLIRIPSRRASRMGALVLGHSQASRFTEKDVRLAHGIAAWAGVALEHTNLIHSLRRAVVLRDRTLAVVSHDLRNPLGAVQLAAQLLRGDIEESMRVRTLDRLDRNVTRMTELIEDLLDSSNIENGTLQLKLENQDVNALMKELCESLEDLAGREQVGLVLVPGDSVGTAELDAQRIGQLMGNLVGNAIKFSEPGTRITVSSQAHDAHIDLAVADQGPGIPPDEMSRLFEPFYKGGHGKAEGAGLGLSIAHGIALGHGGDLYVQSTLGQGTTFTVRLPRSSGAQQKTPPTPPGGLRAQRVPTAWEA